MNLNKDLLNVVVAAAVAALTAAGTSYLVLRYAPLGLGTAPVRDDDRVRCWLFSRRRRPPRKRKPTCAVYGDSRSMMYLPYKSDQEADARQLMVDMFDLVLPEKVSEEVIKKAKKGAKLGPIIVIRA